MDGIDIRLDKVGTPQFLEANLIPSLINGYGNFPKSCLLNSGLDYEEIILAITALGMSHSALASDSSHKLNDLSESVIRSLEVVFSPADIV